MNVLYNLYTLFSQMKKIAQLLAITTAAIAMLSATTFISYNGVQQAFADTKNCAGGTPGTTAANCYCYSFDGGGTACYTNKGDCQKAQRSDSLATSGCFKSNAIVIP
jgi:hypothetical protein